MSGNKDFESHFNRLMKTRGSDVTFDRFETATIENDGNKLHLDVIAAKQSAPTIVFVPGTAAYGLVYGNFLAALGDVGFNVVSFDPRGHGQSGGEPGSYTIEEIISDTRATVRYARERFGDDIFLSGSSQGGIIAFYTAATDEKLSGVICHNAADLADPKNLNMTTHPRIARIFKYIIIGLAKIFPEMKISIARYFALLSKGENAAKERMAKDPYMLKIITLKALASLSSAKMQRPVEKITTPVLMLHAGNDTIFPQSLSEHLHGRLTCDKKLSVYDGLGHFLFSEHVHSVIPDIKNWVEKKSVSSG